MAVIENVLPIEPAQIPVMKNVAEKTDTGNAKSGTNFAKALRIASDKNNQDVDTTVKSDDSTQLATMAGMVMPRVMNLLLDNQQTTKNVADNVAGSTISQESTMGAVQSSQTQLANGVTSGFQTQLVGAVTTGAQTQLANAVMTGAQTQLVNAVTTEEQTQLANAVTTGVQTPLTNAVTTGVQTPLTNAVTTGVQTPLTNEVATGAQTPLTNEVATGAQSPLTNVVATGAQTSLTNVVATGAQTQLASTVATGVQSPLTNVVATGVQSPLTNVVATGAQSPLANTVATGVQTPLTHEVSNCVLQTEKSDVTAKETEDGLSISKNSSQEQLATLLGEVTIINSQADTNQVAPLTQANVEEKSEIANHLVIEQGKVTVNSKNSADVLINNPAMTTVISSVASTNNTNSVAKNTSKQVEDKKTAEKPVTTDTMKSVEDLTMTNPIAIQPVVAQQSTTVIDQLASDDKENVVTLLEGAESSNVITVLPDQIGKNIDAFASLLSQQSMKVENQMTTEAKQVSSSVTADMIASQIVDQARLVTGNKNTEMIIQLKPEHLGELTFKVTVENGVVSASFHSNNPDVRSMVESSLAQLKQDLSNQGLKIDNVGVYSGLGQFFSNEQQSGGYQQPTVKVQNKKTEEEFMDVLESSDSVNRVTDASGIDYRA